MTPFFKHSRLQPFAEQPKNALVADAVLQETEQPLVAERPEEVPHVNVQDPVHLLPFDAHYQRIQCIMLAAIGPEAVRETPKVLVVDGVEHRYDHALENFVLQRSRVPFRLIERRSANGI